MKKKHQSHKTLRNFGQLFLIILLAMVVSSQTQASEISTYQSYWQEVVQYMRNHGRQLRKECEDRPHSSVNSQNISASFQQARSVRNGCRRVKYYLGIIEHGNQQNRQLARREIIDAYIDGDDPYGAMNAATFYVHLYGKRNREDASVILEIRSKIIEVAFDNLAHNRGVDPFWEKMVLGVHSRQNLSNPAFQYYSAALFLQHYPRSSYRNRLMEIVNVASENVQRHMIDPIDQYMRQLDYKAVVTRLNVFWTERDSLVYADALTWSVEAYVKMAEMVRQVGQGRVFKRRCWGRPHVDQKFVTQTIWEEYWDPNNPMDYNEAYQFFLNQADQLINYMDQTVGPHHPASQRAKAYRLNPQQTFADGLRFCW